MHSLSLVEGPGAPASIVLAYRVNVVGRGPSNDIILDGPKVSKRHALLSIRAGEQVFVEDLDSRNGVYVDGHRVTEKLLQPGMSVRIGDCLLVYDQGTPPSVGVSYTESRVDLGYQLVVTDGEGFFEVLPLCTVWVYLGKAEDNDVVLPDAAVSRRHAVLLYQEGAWEIHDLESTNGTYVIGEAIEQARLEPGERIRIGRFLLALENPGHRVSRQELDAEASRHRRRQSWYLPWSLQLGLLGFILLCAAILVAIVLLRLAE